MQKIILQSPPSKEKLTKIDSFQLYFSTLEHIFTSINENINKKNPYYQEVLSKSTTYLSLLSKDFACNADKYTPIFVKSLFTNNYKLAVNIIPNIKKLIQNNFLQGKAPLKYFKLELPIEKNIIRDDNIKNDISDKKIIDILVDTLASIDSIFEDEDIWIFSAECIEEIIKNINISCELKGSTFKKIYMFFFRLYYKFDNDEKHQKMINDNLYYLINTSFFELNLYFSSESHLLNKERKNSKFLFLSDKKDSSYISPTNTGISLKKIYDKLGTRECMQNVKMKNYNPIDLLVCRIVKNIVDTICFRFPKKFPNINNIKKIIPLTPRKNSDFYLSCFRKLNPPDIKNEYAYPAGFFGWCTICRKTASKYCIKTYFPVCSYACKSIITLEDEQLNVFRIYLLDDCSEMLKYFCDILSDKNCNIYQGTMALQIINNIIKKFGKLICQLKNLKYIIKNNLMEGLLKTCLSSEMKLFSISINLFFDIWKYFKEVLYKEISYFNENVIIKIITGSNISFMHKKIVLENLFKRDFIYFMELFINYDCALTDKFLLNNLINTLCDVIKNRLSKQPKDISEKQNLELITLALNTLTFMLQSVFEICKTIYIKNVTPNNDRNKNINKTESMRKKNDILQAEEKLNQNIKLGFAYLKNSKIIDTSSFDNIANGIWSFIQNSRNIKKSQIGEILGGKSEISTKILELFVNKFNFSKLHITKAIKIFLMELQLPDDELEILRILSKFSEKYQNDNPNMLKNSENVLYLTYDILMLDEDFNKNSTEKQMSSDSFVQYIIKQNQLDIPRQFMTEIYYKVKYEPIIIRKNNSSQSIIENNIKNYINMDIEKLINLNKTENKEVKYYKISDQDIIDYLPLFMNTLWNPLIIMYNIIVEESKNEVFNERGIYGISTCIKIFGLLNLTINKPTIISFLCSLSGIVQLKKLKKTNILCIKEILSLAKGDNCYCKGSWATILLFINKLHFYQMLSTLAKNERNNILKKIYRDKEDLINLNIEIMTKIKKEILVDDYEKIFTISFDSESLLEFVKALCDITKQEFEENGITKVFLLQKIVEIGLNQLLIKDNQNIEEIWNMLSVFFVEVGISKNKQNSTTSVDSLRQLVTKYLSKKNNYNDFIPELIKPFEEIFDKCENEKTKEYIIFCLNNIINNDITKIQSGWNIILSIYKKLSSLKGLDIIKNQTLDTLIKIGNIEGLNNDFEDLINCLKEYISTYPEKIINILNEVSKIVNNEKNYFLLLQIYPDLILYNKEEIRSKSINNFLGILPKTTSFLYPKKHNSNNNINNNKKRPSLNILSFFNNSIKQISFWTHLLTEILYPLGGKIADKISTFPNKESSINSYTTISNIDSSISLQSNKDSENSNSNLNINKNLYQYCYSLEKLLTSISSMFLEYFKFNSQLLPSYLEFMEKILFYVDDRIQEIGLNNIKYLYNFNKMKDRDFFHHLVIFLTKIANECAGEELLKIKEKDLNNKKNVVHLINTNIFYSFMHYNIIYLLDNSITKCIEYSDNYSDLNELLDCFELSYNISNKFNKQIKQRIKISEFMNINCTINLLQQYQLSSKNYFFVLNYLFIKNTDETKYRFFVKIMDTSFYILNEYLENLNEFQNLVQKKEKNEKINEIEFSEKEKLLKNYVEVIYKYVFPNLKNTRFYDDDNYRDKFSKIFFELIMAPDLQIREKVKESLNLVYNNLYEKLRLNMQKEKNK